MNSKKRELRRKIYISAQLLLVCFKREKVEKGVYYRVALSYCRFIFRLLHLFTLFFTQGLQKMSYFFILYPDKN